MGLVWLGFIAASVHLHARPEIFSYLFCAYWLTLIAGLYQDPPEGLAGMLKNVIPFPLSMLVWCNLHSGFVTGLVLLTIAVVCVAIEQLYLRRPPQLLLALTVALVCSLAVSLINPYGFGLWQYLPHLFFSPVNQTINELQPWRTSDLANPGFYPFLLLSGITLYVCLRVLSAAGIRKWSLFYSVLSVVSIAAGLRHKRMVTFVVVPMLFCIAYFLGQRALRQSEQVPAISRPEFRKTSWAAVFTSLAACGALLMSSAVLYPQLPMSTAGFHPPFAGIDWLKKHPQSGRLLNDPHYGDVMMWRMNPNPPLYLDSRYDIYTLQLVNDYWDMVRCEENWPFLLDKYQIEWVFLPKGLPLVNRLLRENSWKSEYMDSDSAIIRKH
jgi:hypothetical protein